MKASASGLRWRERELGGATAELAVVRASGEVSGKLGWASGRGDEAVAEGRWGREADVAIRGGAALSW